jgi:hypothetical protein
VPTASSQSLVRQLQPHRAQRGHRSITGLSGWKDGAQGGVRDAGAGRGGGLPLRHTLQQSDCRVRGSRGS